MVWQKRERFKIVKRKQAELREKLAIMDGLMEIDDHHGDVPDSVAQECEQGVTEKNGKAVPEDAHLAEDGRQEVHQAVQMDVDDHHHGDVPLSVDHRAHGGAM